MLIQLLAQLDRGGIQTPDSLAATLGVSEGLIRQMTDQLVRQGYLKKMDNCESGCGHCELKSGCDTHSSGMWMLTERGRRAVKP